jgi:hypothetical protein
MGQGYWILREFYPVVVKIAVEGAEALVGIPWPVASAQVVVVAEEWLTTPHALIGCSQSEPRPDENLSPDLQKT